MNIPIYRAKKIDSDEYVMGDSFAEKYLISKSEFNKIIFEAINHIKNDVLVKDCIKEECKNEHILLEKMLNKLLVNERFEHIYEIDPTTLSIHFPDMLDSKGNKIFASLSEDGKGGDICYVRDFSYGDLQGVARYEDNYFRVHRKGKAMGISLKCKDIKVIGIQE